jgi:hypothetical protein
MMKARLAAAALALTGVLSTAPGRADDVIQLRNGDRITGRVVGETSKSIRIETPYGRLVIPLGRIARVQRQGQREQVLNPPEPDLAATLPRRDPNRLSLVLVVLGRTFWQAWDAKDAPPDPTLRFEVRLDEEPVATFVDGTRDPDEIPGAVVNAFSFLPTDTAIHAAVGVEARPPEVRPGRVVVKIDLPATRAGSRRLRIAYQGNRGSAETPEWKDLAAADVSLDLAVDPPTFVQVRQDNGRMGFSGFPRKRMKAVETFQLDPIVE